MRELLTHSSFLFSLPCSQPSSNNSLWRSNSELRILCAGIQVSHCAASCDRAQAAGCDCTLSARHHEPGRSKHPQGRWLCTPAREHCLRGHQRYWLHGQLCFTGQGELPTLRRFVQVIVSIGRCSTPLSCCLGLQSTWALLYIEIEKAAANSAASRARWHFLVLQLQHSSEQWRVSVIYVALQTCSDHRRYVFELVVSNE